MNAVQVTLGIFLTVLVFIESGAAIKCSVCDTAKDGWRCIMHASPPEDCDGFDYCITVAKYDVNGQLYGFTRSCAPMMFPDMCMPGVDEQTEAHVSLCVKTCDQDGCNVKHSGKFVMELLSRK